MKIGFREKIVIASSALVLLIFAWYFLLYAREKAAIGAIRQEIQELENQIRTAEKSATNIDALKAEVDSLESNLTALKKRILPKTELLTITEQLQEKSRQFGLSITTITVDKSKLFGDENGDSNFLWVPIEIGIEGEFFALGKFLDEFPDFSFIIKPGEIKIATDDTLYPKLSVFLVAYAYVSKA